MRSIWLLPLLACGLLAPVAAGAQGYQRIPTCGTGAPPAGTSPGYMDSTGLICDSATVTGSVAATATASATPTAVAAGTGKPLNISLFSGLFTELGVGGNLVPAGHGVAASALRVELPTDGTGHVVAAVDQTTPGTTNAVQSIPGTSGGLSQVSLQVANNTTSVAIKASAGQLYGLEAYNNSATIAYIKIYNATQGSTTCGAGTPVYRAMIPSNSTSGAGFISMNLQGVAYSTAITMCVTTGYADGDATSPAASAYIVHAVFK